VVVASVGDGERAAECDQRDREPCCCADSGVAPVKSGWGADVHDRGCGTGVCEWLGVGPGGSRAGGACGEREQNGGERERS
jgi:hypothetical protein